MGLIIQDIWCDKKDFKFNFGFNSKPMKRRQYGRNMLTLSSLGQFVCCCVLDQIKTSQAVLGQPDKNELQ